jgi:hypothetical protein
MAKQNQEFDRSALLELAKCYGRAAVDEMIAAQQAESKPEPTKDKKEKKANAKKAFPAYQPTEETSR